MSPDTSSELKREPAISSQPLTLPSASYLSAFVVPQIAASAQTGDPDQDAPLQGMNAWYVEDDPQSCTAMRALLQRWGCSVPLAGGPAEALALAAPGEAPQLVLLDVRLGQVHGPDVYAQLCQRWGQSPPVILVTAERDVLTENSALLPYLADLAPTRHLLVPTDGALGCFDVSRAVSLGEAHRREWVLLGPDAVRPTCGTPARLQRFHYQPVTNGVLP